MTQLRHGHLQGLPVEIQPHRPADQRLRYALLRVLQLGRGTLRLADLAGQLQRLTRAGPTPPVFLQIIPGPPGVNFLSRGGLHRFEVPVIAKEVRFGGCGFQFFSGRVEGGCKFLFVDFRGQFQFFGPEKLPPQRHGIQREIGYGVNGGAKVRGEARGYGVDSCGFPGEGHVKGFAHSLAEVGVKFGDGGLRSQASDFDAGQGGPVGNAPSQCCGGADIPQHHHACSQAQSQRHLARFLLHRATSVTIFHRHRTSGRPGRRGAGRNQAPRARSTNTTSTRAHRQNLGAISFLSCHNTP